MLTNAGQAHCRRRRSRSIQWYVSRKQHAAKGNRQLSIKNQSNAGLYDVERKVFYVNVLRFRCCFLLKVEDFYVYDTCCRSSS